MFRNEIEITLYKKALIEMCKKFDQQYFVTLTFANAATTEKFAHGALKNYLCMVDRDVFGKRSDERIQRLIFKEKNQSDGIHFHILIKLPENKKIEEIKEILEKKWIKTRGNGFAAFKKNEWIKPIDNIEGLAQYLTKQINHVNDDVLVSDLIFYK